MAPTTDVLAEDPELARPLDDQRRAHARRAALAGALELPIGTWDAR